MRPPAGDLIRSLRKPPSAYSSRRESRARAGGIVAGVLVTSAPSAAIRLSEQATPPYKRVAANSAAGSPIGLVYVLLGADKG